MNDKAAELDAIVSQLEGDFLESFRQLSSQETLLTSAKSLLVAQKRVREIERRKQRITEQAAPTLSDDVRLEFDEHGVARIKVDNSIFQRDEFELVLLRGAERSVWNLSITIDEYHRYFALDIEGARQLAALVNTAEKLLTWLTENRVGMDE